MRNCIQTDQRNFSYWMARACTRRRTGDMHRLLDQSDVHPSLLSTAMGSINFRLRGPFCCRMSGDSEMEKAAPVVRPGRTISTPPSNSG